MVVFGPNQTFTRTRSHGHVESYPTGWYTVPGPHHHCNPNETPPAGKRCCCINHAHCSYGLCGGASTIHTVSHGRGGFSSGGRRRIITHPHPVIHQVVNNGSTHTPVAPTQSSPQQQTTTTSQQQTTTTTSSDNTTNLIAIGLIVGVPLIMLLALL